MKVKRTKSPLREWVESIVGAVILTAFIIVFIAQSFVVEGTSMLPTLENNQRLLVDKLTYRFREPRHGDIVVFRYPTNPKEEFIKRIIAVPGDSGYYQRKSLCQRPSGLWRTIFWSRPSGFQSAHCPRRVPILYWVTTAMTA